VALKIARGDEKQRPIAPITELNETRPARPMRGGPRRDFGEKRPFAEKRASGGEKPRFERPAAHPKSREGFPGAKLGGTSHEPGMVRLTMNMGKMHGIRPSDVVGAIAYHADIPGNTIGKIFIDEERTLVDVPEQFVGQVLSKAGKYSIRKQAFTVEKA
jgi:ATP-dependent RNA helicase DeaD